MEDHGSSGKQGRFVTGAATVSPDTLATNSPINLMENEQMSGPMK